MCIPFPMIVVTVIALTISAVMIISLLKDNARLAALLEKSFFECLAREGQS